MTTTFPNGRSQTPWDNAKSQTRSPRRSSQGKGVRVARSARGYDFTRQIALTHELGLGDTVVLERGGEVVGFSIWHAAPLAAERHPEELRVLKLFADSRETFERLMLTLEGLAAREHLPRVAVRMQSAQTAAYQILIERGYRISFLEEMAFRHQRRFIFESKPYDVEEEVLRELADSIS